MKSLVSYLSDNMPFHLHWAIHSYFRNQRFSRNPFTETRDREHFRGVPVSKRIERAGYPVVAAAVPSPGYFRLAKFFSGDVAVQKQGSRGQQKPVIILGAELEDAKGAPFTVMWED